MVPTPAVYGAHMVKVPTAVSRTPKNRNYLSQFGFRLVIMRAPNIEFYVQSCNVPSISLPEAPQATPFVEIPRPGDHLRFGQLDITYKVDEDLKNYDEIRKWMFALGKPTDFHEYEKIEKEPEWTGRGVTSDMSLVILNGVKQANYETVFSDAWPTELGELRFETTDDDVEYITGSASFRFTVFDVKKTH